MISEQMFEGLARTVFFLTSFIGGIYLNDKKDLGVIFVLSLIFSYIAII